MKKTYSLFKILLFSFSVLCCNMAIAQPLSGTYTIAGSSPDFADLKTAATALNVRGISGPVIFNIRDGSYSGSSWQAVIETISGASSANTVTFQSQGGNRAICTIEVTGTSAANYIFKLEDASYIRIKNLTLNNSHSTYGCDILFDGASSYNLVENCVLTGNSSSSSSANKSRIYGTGLSGSENDTFRNNLISRGAYGIYFRGTNTSSTSNGHVFINNEFEENYTYAIYAYYLGDVIFKDNYVHRTGSGTYNGCYFYYTRNGMLVDNNTIEINTTGTTYGLRCEYSNYSSNNDAAYVAITNNNVDVTSKTNTSYSTYIRYIRYGYIANNNIEMNSTNTSGSIYAYLMYYGYNSHAHNNTIKTNKAGGYTRAYVVYAGDKDSATNNTIEILGNTYTYNYLAYSCVAHYVVDNDVYIETNNRTIYGTYIGYDNGIFANNKIVHQSNTGTVTGLYMDYANGSKIYNNLIVTKTDGTNYGARAYYVYPSTSFFNNTVYTSGTGSSNYNIYVYNSSSSYGIKMYNNIFYKTGSSGYNAYVRSADQVFSDHNLYYKPAGDIFDGVKTEANLHDWRKGTGLDRNSIFYDVEFTDAANHDFSIVASNENAWAVNARAMHDTARKTDYTSQAVPQFTEDGVPDIGAFEVTPTSTPPLTIASPAAPVANSTQTFTFGQDTVLTMEWGATVPVSYDVRQYAGTKATPVPAGLERMFFYTEGTPATFSHSYKANTYYKDSWLGNIPTEEDAVMARKSDAGGWVGYNYNNAFRDVENNVLSTAGTIDSVGSYTAVRNGRIGIRCVYPTTGIRFSNITAESVDVNWDAIYNPLGYQLIVKKSPEPPTDAEWGAAQNPTSNSATAANLDEDTKYYAFVRNICDAKDTSAYSIDSFTTIITCHTPVIKLVDMHNTRAVVYWDTVKTAVAYEIALTTSPTPPEYGTTITKTENLFSFLDPGKTYYVHLRANCNTMYARSDWDTKEFATWAVGVSDVDNIDGMMEVYPNPAIDVLTVSLGKKINGGTITIMDITGKQLMKQTAESGKINIDINELQPGVYIVQYANEAGRQQVKFLKQ